MITDWITAISTASATGLALISIGMSIAVKKNAKRKNRERVCQELSGYIDWVNKTELFFKEIFTSSYSDISLQDVINKSMKYKVKENMIPSTLELIRNKMIFELSEGQQKKMNNFITWLKEYIHMYEIFEKALYKSDDSAMKFSVLKFQLRKLAPAYVLDQLRLTDSTELPDILFAYIKKLNEEWNGIEGFLKL